MRSFLRTLKTRNSKREIGDVKSVSNQRLWLQCTLLSACSIQEGWQGQKSDCTIMIIQLRGTASLRSALRYVGTGLILRGTSR